MFYLDNKKDFSLPGLIISLCKWVVVSLLDADEVLHMHPPYSTLFCFTGSTSRNKHKKTDKASGTKAVVG